MWDSIGMEGEGEIQDAKIEEEDGMESSVVDGKWLKKRKREKVREK